MNLQDGFIVPILAVLCNGRSLTFFKFLNCQQTHKVSLQLFIGKFPSGKLKQDIVGMDPGLNMANFFHYSCSLYESLFYIFLTRYHHGLQAYWDRSIEATKKQGHGRQSTPKWQNAMHLASNAINGAKLAHTQ